MYLPPEFPRHDPVGDYWFAAGVNYPYIWTTGSDIGPNPILGRSRTSFNAARRDQLRDDFARLKNWGVDIVRMFAFEDGEGLTWRRVDSHWVVNGIEQQFLNNVASIAIEAQTVGIRIYWCLLQSANFDTPRYQNRPAGYQRMSRSFRYMLDNTHALHLFLEQALRPFIRTLLSSPGGLFAIDLMNEPDMLWPVTPANINEAVSRTRPELRRFLRMVMPHSYPEYLRREAVQREREVIDFLYEMAHYIKCRYRDQICVSTGFAYSNTFQRHHYVFGDLFDFYDSHLYDVIDVTNLNPNLPTINYQDIGNKPCIIGECGLGGQVAMERLRRDFIGQGILQFSPQTTLRDLFLYQAVCIDHCLTSAHGQGFAGCLIWEYGRQFERVFDWSRSLTLTRYCPNVRRGRGRPDCLDWADRIPLLWRKKENEQVPPTMCVHLRNPEDRPVEELCGRPVVWRIRRFADDLTQAGRRPNY